MPAARYVGVVIAPPKKIFSIAPLKISKPTIDRKTTIINPATASALPCPKGCSLSAGLLPTTKPAYEITDVVISDMV